MKIYRVADDKNDKIKIALEKCPQEYGFNLTSDRRVASIDWNASDLHGGKWTEKSVKSYLGIAEDSVVYRTLADVNDLDEVLVEEEDDIEGGYDWSELSSRRSFPPPIVITRTKNDKVVINDGNHRTRYFNELGKQFIPCWCYDEMITEWTRKRNSLGLTDEDLDEEGNVRIVTSEKKNGDEIDLHLLYDSFKDTYVKATGATWDKNKFIDKAKNCTFYGGPDGYVMTRLLSNGCVKLISFFGNKFSILTGLKELKAENLRVFGIGDIKLKNIVSYAANMKPYNGGKYAKLISLLSNILPELGLQKGIVNDNGTITRNIMGKDFEKVFFANDTFIDYICSINKAFEGFRQ